MPRTELFPGAKGIKKKKICSCFRAHRLLLETNIRNMYKSYISKKVKEG